MTSTSAGGFEGFGVDAVGFLRGLDADNSKSYFDEHRATYTEQVHSPLKALVDAVGERLRERAVTDVEFEPRIGRSMFRINRDLRFSKDPTPYHPHLDLAWWIGESPKTSPAFILRIRHDEVLTGVGVYGMSGERLDRWRAAVTSEAGSELDRILATLTAAPVSARISNPTRRRVPKGFDADHVRARWLLHDSIHLSSIHAVPDVITTAAFADWVVERHVEIAPLAVWLVPHLREGAAM